MFDLSMQEIDLGKENTILKTNINLDTDLDCFIIVSSKDSVFAENIMNNAIENLIDKISIDDTYNDFGIALENINSYIKSWYENQDEGDDTKRVDMVIALLNDNNFMFSNIGKTGVYLLSANGEFVQLTEKGENKKEFLFISNGILSNGDIVVASTLNLLKYLTKSDLVDGMILADEMEMFGKNIKNILEQEIVNKNAVVASIKYKPEHDLGEESFGVIKELGMKIADLKISKHIAGVFFRMKDKLDTQPKQIKNIVLLVIMLLILIFLYFFITSLASKVTNTDVRQEVVNSIEEIQKTVDIASENLANPEIFRINIEKAEQMISEVEKKNLYKENLQSLNDEINILKKQFNKIEIFEAKKENLVYAEDIKGAFAVAKNNKKMYIFTDKGVSGPIVAGQKAKLYVFTELKEGEKFIDHAFIGDNIFLLTNNSQIVRFSSNSRFAYVNVSRQPKWEEMKSIDGYSGNLYILGKDNQIYRHRATTKDFSAGIPYLKEEERKKLGNIIGMAIDGGFYLVKENLEVEKFFSSPYRLQGLVINQLPKNYTLTDATNFKIKVGNDFSYVYMLLDNKIWFFKTNSNKFQNTASLTYLGQVEGSQSKILDFYVESEKELLVLNETGVYSMRVEINDGKIGLR